MPSLTRQALYELVWSKPMKTLAAEHGISDVGLKKVCAKAAIPVPERGYWAKRAADRPTRQPPLGPRDPGMPDIASWGAVGNGWAWPRDLEKEVAQPLPEPPVFEEDMASVEARVRKRVGKVNAVGSSIDTYLRIERAHAHIFHPDDQRAFGLTGEAARELRIAPADAWAFFLASWRASRRLKRRHIRDVVHDVRARKERAGVQPTDLEAFRRQAAIFRRLRPWYPRSYLCIFDSLALVEFLARRRLYPLWIFAVQAQPFGAHCWVQAGGHLLKEGSEYAAQFTPIMAI